jgi:hypothetical protein
MNVIIKMIITHPWWFATLYTITGIGLANLLLFVYQKHVFIQGDAKRIGFSYYPLSWIWPVSWVDGKALAPIHGVFTYNSRLRTEKTLISHPWQYVGLVGVLWPFRLLWSVVVGVLVLVWCGVINPIRYRRGNS